MRKRFAIFLAALLSLLIVGAACTQPADDDAGDDKAKKVVKIAYVGPKTGDAANLGLNILAGVQLAVEEANKSGDLDVTIELEEFDTQGDPAQAQTLKDKFIGDEDIIGIVGPAFSGETKAVLPSLDEASLVMVSASATNAALPTVVTGTSVFHRIIPDDDVQGKGLTDYFSKVLKPKSIAYVHDNSEYGKGLAEGTQKLNEAAGLKTAVVEAIDPKASDFSAAVNKVKGSGADVLFYGGYYAEGGRLAKQLKDGGYRGKFISGDGALDPGFVQNAGSQGEGALISCPCKLATEDGEGDLGKFAKAYNAKHSKVPGTYSTEGYDAANILIEGISKGNTTREKLLEFVEGLDSYEGVSKDISFEDNGNVKATDVFVYEVKGGKLVLVGGTAELTK